MELLIYSVLVGSLKQSSGVMCSQCDSDLDPYCVERPPAPQNCTLCGQFDEQSFKCTLYHEVQYCITERRYMNDTLIRITRDCSPASMPDSCEFITQLGSTIKVCFRTCKINGCNSTVRQGCFSGKLIYLYFIVALLCMQKQTYLFD